MQGGNKLKDQEEEDDDGEHSFQFGSLELLVLKSMEPHPYSILKRPPVPFPSPDHVE